MPLTAKGEKILRNLEAEYGTEHGKEVLYAGKNSGKFTGIDARIDAIVAKVDSINSRIEALITK